jgi:very-short-patch-repair endonuclease
MQNSSPDFPKRSPSRKPRKPRDAAIRRKKHEERLRQRKAREVLIADRQKKLLKNRTPSEIRIGECLSSLGLSFEEQKRFGKGRFFYFADFYLPQYHIILEVDGKYHDDDEQRSADGIRELRLLTYNNVSRIARVTNEEALGTEAIKVVMERLFPHAARFFGNS